MDISPIFLELSKEDQIKEARRERLLALAEKRVNKLTEDSCAQVENLSSNRLFELDRWRSFKMEIDKLFFVLEKLVRELKKMNKYQS